MVGRRRAAVAAAWRCGREPDVVTMSLMVMNSRAEALPGPAYCAGPVPFLFALDMTRAVRRFSHR
eukprot:16449941-Heterocapsa_arctica.AAC.1